MKRLMYLFLVGSTVLLFAKNAPKEENKTVQKDTEVSHQDDTVKTKKTVTMTRGDVKIIEASENIRYLSQKIAKDYFYFYKNPMKKNIKDKLFDSLAKLSRDFRIIATTTKDADTKDILEFLAYSKDQIAEIFADVPDEEKAALMLDYSETLLEGANSIAEAHKYDFSKEEKMLMVTKKIEYLLERIGKYYMALHTGFNTTTNQEQLILAMKQLEINVEQIGSYSYPKEIANEQEMFLYAWRSSQIYFDTSKTLFIPTLMFLSIDHIESIVAKIAIYHSKNQ
jgi:signal peptidase I